MELMRKCALSLVLHGVMSGLILAAFLLIAAPATAARLIDLDPPITEEIWFPVDGGTAGVAPPRLAEYVWNSSFQLLCVGSGDFVPAVSGPCSRTGLSDYELRVVSQTRELPAIQFPQFDGNPVSLDNPFVADTSWTLLNTTGSTLPNTLLIFNNVDLVFEGDVPGGYPPYENSDPSALTGAGAVASAFGLDARVDLLKIMEYYSVATSNYYYYGVGDLGSIPAGETAKLTVRYIVNAGPMPVDENGVFLLPPLGVLAATVPEPSTAFLLGSGLLGLAVAGKRRS